MSPLGRLLLEAVEFDCEGYWRFPRALPLGRRQEAYLVTLFAIAGLPR